MKVSVGNRVKILYVTKDSTGAIVDSSKNFGDSLEINVGKGEIIPRFEEQLIGLGVGEERNFHLTSGEAYGNYNPEYLEEIPLERLPAGVQKGDTVHIGLSQGEKISARVLDIMPHKALIDMNHPLAGKELWYRVRVLEIN